MHLFEIAFEMDVEPKCKKKILRMKLLNHLKSHLELIIFIFLYILYLDKAIAKLQNRFEQFKIYEDIFGFLVFYLVLKI